jgi:hypothetical protein
MNCLGKLSVVENKSAARILTAHIMMNDDGLTDGGEDTRAIILVERNIIRGDAVNARRQELRHHLHAALAHLRYQDLDRIAIEEDPRDIGKSAPE